MTGTETALAALTMKALPSEAQTMDALLARQLPAIERALPHAIGAERFTRLVLTEMRRTPALYDCSPQTVLGAMMLAAQLGVEPGPLGHAYLVPFTEHGHKVCTFVLGYRGMIELASRSGRVRSIIARPVYEGDEFDYAYGIADKLVHRPCPPADRGAERLYYGLARFAAPTGNYLHVMWPEEAATAKSRSALGRLNKGPWQTDPLAMALKSVVRRMHPWLPQSVHLARALEADERPVELGPDGTVEAEAVEDDA